MTNTDHFVSNVHCFYAIQKVNKSKSFGMSLNNYINLLLICLVKKEGIFICWYLAYLNVAKLQELHSVWLSYARCKF